MNSIECSLYYEVLLTAAHFALFHPEIHFQNSGPALVAKIARD